MYSVFLSQLTCPWMSTFGPGVDGADPSAVSELAAARCECEGAGSGFESRYESSGSSAGRGPVGLISGACVERETEGAEGDGELEEGDGQT